ncbi:hypothetical protein AOLI_G00247000 [Acnodon oligacanthus]
MPNAKLWPEGELNLTPYVSFLDTLIRQEENTNAVKAESWTFRGTEGRDKVDCHRPAVNTNACFGKEDNSKEEHIPSPSVPVFPGIPRKRRLANLFLTYYVRCILKHTAYSSRLFQLSVIPRHVLVSVPISKH